MLLEFIVSNLCQGLFEYISSLVKQIESCFQVDQQFICVVATVSKKLLFTEACHTPCFGNKTSLRPRPPATEENEGLLSGCWPDSRHSGEPQRLLWSYCFLPCLFLQALVHGMECSDCLSHLEWSFGMKIVYEM